MHTQLVNTDALTFERDGAQRLRAAVNATDLHGIVGAIAGLPPKRAGVRLYGIAALRPFLSPTGSIGQVAASVLGSDCRPVRAILFDKTAEMNWSLTWHQDRTIAVTQRIEVDGFGPWTVKDGLLHVAPPFDLLAGMVTLRVHLDPVPIGNAPLLIAPGSHRLGRIPERKVPDTVKRCGTASAWRRRAISGSTPRRYCMPPTPRPGRRGVGCCKSTMQSAVCRAGLSGLECKRIATSLHAGAGSVWIGRRHLAKKTRRRYQD